jgi:hypothetical protein
MKIKTAFKIFLGAMILIFTQIVGFAIYYYTKPNLDWMVPKLIGVGVALIPLTIFWLILLTIGLRVNEKERKNNER